MNLSFPKKRRAAETASSASPDRPPRWKWATPPRPLRLAVLSLVAVAGLAAATGVALEVTKQNIGPLPLEAAEATSVTVLDRENRLLRAFTTKDGRWRLPLDVSEVDPRYLAMLMAFEDKRFYEHGGVDFLAILRAGYLLARHGAIKSGGSTLTMQVARLLEGKHERTGPGKLRQIARALQLEERLSKPEILRLYLRLAPFGGNIEGVRAASLAYFGKEPRHLSAGEAALLVALPQSPEVRRPDRNSEAARRARNRVLDRAVEEGVLPKAEAERAKGERIPKQRLEVLKLAPHLSESEVAAHPGRTIHRLTLDRDLQAAVETLATEQTKLLGPKLSAAVLVVDHTTGEVLAHVGSAGYLDPTRQGAIDMTAAIRSPGSTLKPFIYGLAFENGLAHPETLIEDRPTRFGNYRPQNFDEDFHGTITIREALGNSLNVPAVKVLAAVGPGRLMGRIRRAGVEPALPNNAQPSLAIALGGLGMTLKDLTTLYAGLARGGDPIALTWRREDANAKPTASARRRLLSPVSSWYVTDILKGAPPPPNTKGGAIAYKTGTSYGYRDAWAVGYDGRHVVAVWVGRPDAASTPGLMGRLSAAPILFDTFARISERRTPFRTAPAGVIKATGSELPQPLKRFREPGDDTVATGPYLEPPVLISFPPDRSELDMEEREAEPLIIKAEGGALPLTWLIDGDPVVSDPLRRETEWLPDGRGFAKLTVIDAKGQVDRVTIRLR
ncbi:penicillin-binding protein 1C [Hyphomicrobium sp.]|uniref:penicillin-binding protein 1C n=1 Tax=Hyphomicrobium sp. TaxID=82 RepID=UPI003F71B307